MTNNGRTDKAPDGVWVRVVAAVVVEGLSVEKYVSGSELVDGSVRLGVEKVRKLMRR